MRIVEPGADVGRDAQGDVNRQGSREQTLDDFRSGCPSRNSMAMKYFSSATPTSLVCTMFGWLSLAASRASSRNMSRKCASATRPDRRRLITTSLLKPAGPRATARYTWTSRRARAARWGSIGHWSRLGGTGQRVTASMGENWPQDATRLAGMTTAKGAGRVRTFQATGRLAASLSAA